MNLFKNNKEIKMERWIPLNNEEQLVEIKENSKIKTVAIFKHSTRCGISLHAKHKLESAWNIKDSELDFYYLDLLSYRNISNSLAEVFGVAHQSPQIIIIKNEKAIDHFSHQSITVERLKKNV